MSSNNRDVKTMPVRKERARFAFSLEKDLNLLRATLQTNPWQLGNWSELSSTLKVNFGYQLSVRAVKLRINLLLEKYKSQQLTYKTGTEEMKTECGELLESVSALVEESKTEINVEVGADVELTDELVNSVDAFDQNDLAEFMDLSPTPTVAARRQARRKADDERDAILEANFAPEASNLRKKRTKLSVEDEMIQKRQNHEIELEKMKTEKEMERQRERQKHEIEMEKKKMDMEIERQKEVLVMENRKLALEEVKEARKDEKNRRRDELALAQLEYQKNLLTLLGKGVTQE